MWTLTTDVGAHGHLTVVHHGLSARRSEPEAAAVHLGAAERAGAERLRDKQDNETNSPETMMLLGHCLRSQSARYPGYNQRSNSRDT